MMTPPLKQTGSVGVPFQGVLLLGMVVPWRCHGLEEKCPYGAADLVQVSTGFLTDAERLAHGVPVANHR